MRSKKFILWAAGVLAVAVGVLSSVSRIVAAPAPAAPAAAPVTPGGWPEGWLFKVVAPAKEKAYSYDVVIEHAGLAQPDARDVRVFSAAGQPVSHFIAYADPLKTRVVFDGGAGPGDYVVYFGNLSPTLPAIPEVAALGDKNWLPKGGYSVVSYGQVLPLTRRDVLGHKVARASLAKAFEAAKAKADEAKTPVERARLFKVTPLRGTNAELPPNYYHVFTARFDVAKAAEYEIVCGTGAASELGIVYLDANDNEPLIEGSFKTPDAFMVIATGAKTNLSAGVHELRMYTNRRSPDIRVRPAGGTPNFLTGLDAHYDESVTIVPGAMDSGATPLAEAYLTAVKTWADQGRFAHARALARLAQRTFPGDAEHAKLFGEQYDRAGQATYDKNWLTEGKYPSRTGAVPDAVFTPPLRLSGTTAESPVWDARHNGSAVSLEGRVIYGLPFEVMLGRPWGVTSASCVDDDVLYVGAKNGVMHAVYLASGSEKWQFAGGGACLGAPLVYQGVVYYGAVDRRLYAVDAQRGRMLWNFPTSGWIEGGPAAADGRIYFGSRDGNLYAVDARRGVERWHADLSGPILATPCSAGGKVFVGTRGGDFCAVDAVSGQLAWKYPAGAAIEGGACVNDNRVSFGDRAGRVHSLDTATGKLAWKAPADVKGPVLAAPILVGPILFGGTEDGTLFGIDSGNGVVGWEAPMPGGGAVARPPIFAGDTLTFTSRAHSPMGADGKVSDLRGNSASFVVGPGANNIKWARATSTITPDGTPGEPAWKEGESFPGLLKPSGLGEPDGPADVRLLWDEKNLYVAATCKSSTSVATPDPANPRGGDALSLLIDPARNGSVVYEFTVTPDGQKALLTHTAVGIDKSDAKNAPLLDQIAKGEKQRAWAPNWSATVKKTGAASWSAEIVIPLDAYPKGINPPNANVSWRFNVLLADHRIDTAGRPAPVVWGLSPVSTAEPLGVPNRWPTGVFQPKPKP